MAPICKDPHVGVFVQELQSHSVSVVGAVKMPGVFQIRGTKTVIEVLSMAQGLTDDAGGTVLIMHGAGYAESGRFDGPDSSRTGIATVPPFREVFPRMDGFQSMLPEKNGEIEEINLKKLLESADSALNLPVRPGDIVKVPPGSCTWWGKSRSRAVLSCRTTKIFPCYRRSRLPRVRRTLPRKAAPGLFEPIRPRECELKFR